MPCQLSCSGEFYFFITKTGAKKIQTPADRKRNTNAREILDDEQEHQNHNIAGPESVAAAATEQDQNAKEDAIDDRTEIQTNHHSYDGHDKTYLQSSPTTSTAATELKIHTQNNADNTTVNMHRYMLHNVTYYAMVAS